MGAMACAARLAVKGHNVKVLEQNASYGGKLSEYQHDSSKFDLGPNLLHFPAVYRDLFLKTGGPLEDSIELVDSSETFRYHFPDGSKVTLPGLGVGLSAEAIGDALGGSSADEWRSFIRRGSAIWSVTRKALFEAEQSGFRGFARLIVNRSEFRTVAPFQTLRTLASQYLSDPRLISIVDRYALEVGSDPRSASTAIATQPYLEQTLGAYQVVGGMTKLSQALYERCLSLGVEFEFNSRVEKINIVNEETNVETVSGELLKADIYITNFNPAILEHSKIKKTKLTPSLSCLTFLFETKPLNYEFAINNYFIPNNPNNELDSLFSQKATSSSRSDYSIKISQGQSESMNSAISVSIPVPPASQPDLQNWLSNQNIENIKSDVLSALTRHGIELTGKITWEKVLTPLDYQSFTNSPMGATYPLVDTGIRSRYKYPASTTSIPNLFVVGAATHPGGGLAQVGISAELLADRIGRAT